MTQLDCPLADEDTDDEDDQPPQQAHTLRHQLRGEADERKPDIICFNYSFNLSILHLALGNMTVSISTWQIGWLP